jgi:hypothetical protein
MDKRRPPRLSLDLLRGFRAAARYQLDRPRGGRMRERRE